eukprot:3393176-Prymnesium_polylepis.1
MCRTHSRIPCFAARRIPVFRVLTPSVFPSSIPIFRVSHPSVFPYSVFAPPPEIRVQGPKIQDGEGDVGTPDWVLEGDAPPHAD